MLGTVLVTGAYGFVGRHVARRFADAGWSVAGIGHGTWAREEWRKWGLTDWHSSDITLDALMAYAGGAEVVVHCAGSGSVAFSMNHPQRDFQRTVTSTVAVLEFVRLRAPHARFVYPSSAGVYGVAEKLPINEAAPLLPVSPYGVHKKMAEEMCRVYAQHFGVSAAIVRLFSVYGAGLRKQLLWDACVKISNGENMFFGTGQETRDWLHINDAVALLMAASEHASTECPIVNGGSGLGVTVREVLSVLLDSFDRCEEPQFCGKVRSGDPIHYVADVNSALAWGWNVETDWRKGMREYADWFKKVGL